MIAAILGLDSTGVAFLRNALVNKGMIYSRQYVMNEFTVPMFDAFMRRTMPDWEPGRLEEDSGDPTTAGRDDAASVTDPRRAFAPAPTPKRTPTAKKPRKRKGR